MPTKPLNNNNVHHKCIDEIKKIVQDKSVLYIATKTRDYLRIQQEISLLEQYAKEVHIVASVKKNYFLRLVYVYLKTLFYFKRYDVVFVGFAPQLVVPFLKWRFFNKIVIIDFFISLHDTLINDRQKYAINSTMSKALLFFDQLTLKWTHFIITDTQQHARYFIDALNANEKITHTLYLQADGQYYYPQERSKPPEISNKFVVLYFGTVLPLQGTDIIIEAINSCEIDDIYFIMIGPFEQHQCTNSNVKFIKWLEQKQLSQHIAYADLCLAGHFNTNIEKASRTIPGKAYIYESMQKTMILGDNDANKERYPLLYTDVIFVQMGNAQELLKAIINQYQGTLNE